MNWLWFILAGLAAGLLSGMGMGGGTVLIPILTLLLSMDQHAAQGVNMIVFLPGALLALWIHRRDGRLAVKEGLSLLLWGVMGAAAGAYIATCLSAEWLKKAFGVFLIALAFVQWRSSGRKK
jgi:uncharacterized membrane protein YfcA